MRFLICPGMARAGTTFLWHQLAKNGDLFNISKQQELKYLHLRGATLEGYLQKFKSCDESKIFLDVSPIYLYRTTRVLENIKDVLRTHQVQFVLTIRSPVEQAFSLYLHRIRGNVALLADGELPRTDAHDQYIFDSRSFFRRNAIEVAQFAEAAIRHFGRQSVTFIDFDREFRTESPHAKLEALFGVGQKVEVSFERHFKEQWLRLSELLGYDFLKFMRHRDLVVKRTMLPAFIKNLDGVKVGRRRQPC